MIEQPIELCATAQYNHTTGSHDEPKSTGVWVLPRHVQAVRLKATDYSGNPYVPTYGNTESDYCKVALVLHGGGEIEVSDVLYKDSTGPTEAKLIADQLWPKQEERSVGPYR